MEIKSQNGWLYQHAGYCLPPEGAISAEEALEIARKETGASGWIGENIICCMICQRVFLDGRQKGGRYDHVWCLEIDCMTGEVLDVREYTYTPDSNPMMMYVPFSLLSEVPSFEKEPDSVNSERRILTQAEKESAYQTEHGAASIYFLPLEKQAELFGGFHTAPSREEYDKALAIVKKLSHQGTERTPWKRWVITKPASCTRKTVVGKPANLSTFGTLCSPPIPPIFPTVIVYNFVILNLGNG